MDWSKGYSASYHITRIDPATWRDIETIRITGGSVSRSQDGLMQSADIDCVNYNPGREIWIRVWLDADQSGAHAHEAIFTGIATSPGREFNGRMSASSLECYSVLKPCDDIALPRGWYAPSGMPGALIVRQLLRATPAPCEAEENSPELASEIVAEDGETNLTMISKILAAINWRMRISGDGRIRVIPKSSDPVAVFEPIGADVIETKISVTEDWYSCPNVLMAISEDLTAVARDDSERSPLSTVNRGREVWSVEADADLGANETIAEYAARRLGELQTAEISADYDRRFVPDVMPGDVVRLNYPDQGLSGDFAVDSQSIDLGYAARTSETITAPARLAVGANGEKELIIGLARLIDEDNKYFVTGGDDFIAAMIAREE